MLNKGFGIGENLNEVDTIRVSEKALIHILKWSKSNSELVKKHRRDIQKCVVEISGFYPVLSLVVNESQTKFYVYTESGSERAILLRDTGNHDVDDCMLKLLWADSKITNMLGGPCEAENMGYVIEPTCLTVECLIAFISCFPTKVVKHCEPIGNPMSSKKTRIVYYIN